MKTMNASRIRKDSLILGSVSFLSLLLVGGCCHHSPPTPAGIEVDPDGNGIFEPGETGETVAVEPSWHNNDSGFHCPSPIQLTGIASSFTGPPGPKYTINDPTASYAIPLGGTRSCAGTGNCYGMSVSSPGTRPATHWDATFTETESGSYSPDPLLSTSGATLGLESLSTPDSVRVWTLHIGKSFSDVPTSNIFYSYIENLFHNGITAGCGTTEYCPDNSSRRDQMAVFLLKAEHGAGYLPPPCGGRFADVPCRGPFTDWVEQINSEGIIADCGGGNFCPSDTVTRRDMAAWLLKARYGTGYTPPVATGIFGDVPITDPSAPWIEDLYNRQITAGCNSNPLLYCPDNPNTRGQMAVFIVKTFGLRLYGL